MSLKIRLNDVSRNFGKQKVLEKISFDVYENELVSIIGHSGCGKTTLLYLIQGLLRPGKGTIFHDGKLSFVFQDHNLFPWMTVRDNIEVSPRNLELSDIHKISDELLDDIGLMDYKDFYPDKLSHGMRQRVGIARALAKDPDIVLMDEPFASLDYLTRLMMQDFLQDLRKKKNITIVFVTHDIDEAIRISDKIVILSKRPARVKSIFNSAGFKDKAKLKKMIMGLLE